MVDVPVVAGAKEKLVLTVGHRIGRFSGSTNFPTPSIVEEDTAPLQISVPPHLKISSEDTLAVLVQEISFMKRL